MSRKVLIIGGSYFVGKIFVEHLLEKEGNDIYVLNRGNRPIDSGNITQIIGDRHDVNLGKVLPGITWDVIVDFCAYTFLDVVQLMMAVTAHNIKQYIFISTTSVYEDSLDLPIKEDAPKLTGPCPELGAAADYGFDKWQAELKLMELCQKGHIPYTILRPTIIYGKYNYAPRESYFFNLILADAAVALPKNKLALFQFVSVWDVAEAICLCMGNPKAFNRVFNLAAEELVSYERYIQVLSGIADKQVSTYGLDQKEIEDQQIALPFPLEQHMIYSGTLAEKTLGLQYTPFADGMKRTWGWYVGTRAHGDIYGE